MGTITRSFANNIGTSGILKAGAFNNASLDNVTAVNNAIATGGMKLISSQTASSSASISFTTGIDSTYKEYQFYFINIHSQNDDVAFQFNLSTDGGSNYNVTKTTTLFYYNHDEADTGTALSYDTSVDLAQSTSDQIIIGVLGNDNDQNVSGALTLFNPASTTYVKHFLSNVNNSSYNNYTVGTFMAGYANTTSAVNAIRFKMGSGNIDDGTILMFGIK